MVVLLFILLVSIGIAGYHFSSKNLFAPYVLMPAIWSFILFFYLVADHGLFTINNKFPIHLLLWSVGFLSAAFLSEKLTPASVWHNRPHKPQPNEMLIRLYIVLFTIAVIVIGSKSLSLALQYGKLFFYLRAINIGYDDLALDFGLLSNFTVFGIIVFLIELDRYSDSNKWRVYFLLVLNVFFFVLTMSKTNFLAITISSLYVLHIKGKVNIKKIFLAAFIFGVFSIILQYVRRLENEEFDMMNFFSVYLASSSVAFDQITFPPTENFGENTFRIFYVFKNLLGSSVTPINTVLDFNYVGSITNTYTTMYPFYVDFKTTGVLIFSIITGWIYGFTSKKSITGSIVQRVQYAYFTAYIIMQFIGEFFFTNISFTLQLIIYAYLPFMFSNDEAAQTTS